MRHLRWFAVVAIVFFSFTSRAGAQGLGREWLEKLSGPGPFDGFNYRFALGPLDRPIKGLRTASADRPLCKVCLDVEFGDLANYAEDRPQHGLVTITSSQFFIMVPITALNMRGALEVGGGLGWTHFRGDTFDFNKLTVPVQGIVKPLRFIPKWDRRLTGIFQIVIPVLIFPQAIRREDFTNTNFSFEPDHFVAAEHKVTLMFDASSYIFGR